MFVSVFLMVPVLFWIAPGKHLIFFSAPKSPPDMDIDIELWDNKTITSGLKNYLR